MSGSFTHPVDPRTGDLNWDSASEMMALIAVLYAEDREAIEKIVRLSKPRAAVRNLYIRGEQEGEAARLITSHILLQDGNRHWIAITGTQDKPMWKRNISGAFVRKNYFAGSNVAVHGYFGNVADVLFDRLNPLIVEGQGVEVTVAGHSLGGGVANLLAMRLKEARPGRKVYCQGFGEPRSLGRGSPRPSVDRKWRITNEWDPITQVPPDGDVLKGVALLSTALSFYPHQDWQHYGELKWIHSNGTAANEQPPEGRTVVETASEVKTIGAHMPNAYVRTLSRVQRNYGYSQRSAAMLAVAANSYGWSGQSQELGLPSPDAMIDVDALNSSLGAESSTPFDATTWRTYTVSRVEPTTATVGPEGSLSSRFSGNSGVNPMSSTVTQVSLWRVVAQVNNSLYGNSHSVVMKGPRTTKEAIDLAKKWVTARASLLGSDNAFNKVGDGAADPTLSSPRYQFMTVQDALDPRNSTPVELNGEVGAGYAAVTNGNTSADVFSAAMSLRMQGVSEGTPPKRSFHVETFVGFPDKALEKGAVQWGVKVKVDKSFRKAMDEYIALITDANSQFGFMGIDTAVPKKLVETFTTDVEGQLRCKVTGHGYDTGDYLNLTGKVGKALRRTYRIGKIDADNFTLLGTRVRDEDKPRIGTVQRVRKADGTRQLVFYRFLAPTAVAIDGGYLVKISKRNLRPRTIPVSFVQKA